MRVNMARNDATKIIDNLEDEEITFKYSITSYGADFPVDGLVKRIGNEDITIPPFQRGYVWNVATASRFIESLLLGLPVPGIFLYVDPETEKLVVIDGQQRLKTLLYFYNGHFEDSSKEFLLKNVTKQYLGKKYSTIEDQDRRRMDDSILHATIVKQDEPSDDDSSIYHIFERLNTGGMLLSPQEIRASIYRGKFNDLLGELNEDDSWRGIFGNKSKRGRDEELILRFFALYYDSDNYLRPMKQFLNKFMKSNKHLDIYSKDDLISLFVESIQLIDRVVGNSAFKPKNVFNAAIYDAVMYGVSKRLAKGKVADETKFTGAYNSLLKSNKLKMFIDTATANEENVKGRLEFALETFAKIK